MIIVYGINSLYYDFVGASPISGFDSHFSHFAQGFVALGSSACPITFYALIAVFLSGSCGTRRALAKHFRYRR